jgi:hypothetical protein
VLLYSMHLGDMYDDLIMPDELCEDNVGGEEIVMTAIEFPCNMKMPSNPNIWIGDTAASVHMTPFDHGTIPETKTGMSETITVGNGKKEMMTKYGSIIGTVRDKHGRAVVRAMLKHVAHSPKIKFNLCSLSILIQDNWNLKGISEMIWVENNNVKLEFDIKITTASGVVYCMYLQRDTELANPAVFYNVTEAHERLGNYHKDATRATTKDIGLNLRKGGTKKCSACTIAKDKQKTVIKISDHVKSNVVGERMFLDLSSVKPPKKGVKIPQPRWRMLVDEETNLKISHWYAKKNEMVDPTCELIKMLFNKGIVIKIIRLDNAGENIFFGKEMQKQRLEV